MLLSQKPEVAHFRYDLNFPKRLVPTFNRVCWGQRAGGGGASNAVTESLETGNPYRRGRLGTVGFPVLTSLDQMLLILQTVFAFLQSKAHFGGVQLY